MNVGKSSRTPFKHWVLNHHLGTIAGVLSTRPKNVPARPDPFFHVVDLCAGDGVCTEDHQSSPAIIARHVKFLENAGIPTKTTLIEKSPGTHRQLTQNVAALGIPNCLCVQMDARDFRLSSRPRQATFINCDPNHIEDMPLASQVIAALTPATTLTLTLGCNVSGLKMLPRDRRAGWYDYANALTRGLPGWHDALLIALKRDCAQWAYILRIPIKWAPRHAAQLQKKGNAMWPHGVTVTSFRSSPHAFADALDRLFLTKKELEG